MMNGLLFTDIVWHYAIGVSFLKLKWLLFINDCVIISK